MTIDLVPVGNAGNAADSTGIGSVGYPYSIGKYEVTNAQYVGFLNTVDPMGTNQLGLYISAMTNNVPGGINFNSSAATGSKYSVKPGRGQNPVIYVSWYDAIRFANWMHNGQGPGSTESGAYTLLGGTPIPSNGANITRVPGATWFLPNENEWYKAAYHQPADEAGDADSYWLYPTRSNTTPYSDQPPGSGAPDPSNTGNFYKSDSAANGYDDGYAITASSQFFQNVNHLTDVGAYAQAASFYGTYDQGGNVYEWNEQAFSDGASRGLRGSSWQGAVDQLAASNSNTGAPDFATGSVGFRLATIAPIVVDGDYNGDAAVDAADYVVWRKSDGTPSGYHTWRTNFGQAVGGGAVLRSEESLSAAVPEPTNVLPLLVLGVSVWIRRCRQVAWGSIKTSEHDTA